MFIFWCLDYKWITLQKIVDKQNMELIKAEEANLLKGGGFWYQDTDGQWHYIENDEDPDEEFHIFP